MTLNFLISPKTDSVCFEFLENKGAVNIASKKTELNVDKESGCEESVKITGLN